MKLPTQTIVDGEALAVLREMKSETVHCIVTSPPYWKSRTIAKARIRCETRETDIAHKNLVGIPWRVAFALQDDEWILRSEIIWAKKNPCPESVKDRPTKAHETLFMFSRSQRYAYDYKAVLEPATGKKAGNKTHKHTTAYLAGDERLRTKSGLINTKPTTERNMRTVWWIASEPFSGAHFAVMPTALVRPCILAGSPVGGIVLDPFAGAGTVGVVAKALGRSFVGIELEPSNSVMARERIERSPAPGVP